MKFLLINIDWNSLLSGLVGAVVGGAIAAFSTMWAAGRSTKKAFNYSRDLQDEADRESLRRLLLAIKAEVETIWSGYQVEVGHHIEELKTGEGLDLVYKLRQQYFTVYDANAQWLGLVEDDRLRAAIVRTYTLSKGLVDTHLLNNDLLTQKNNVSGFEGHPLSTSPALQQYRHKVLQQWKSFGSELKTAYQQTKESVELLLRLMEESDALTRK
jgi:gas vesicle protein